MDRSFFDKSVCREGNGNMKGAFAETVPAKALCSGAQRWTMLPRLV